MKRLVMACALVLPLVVSAAGPAQAEVKTREKAKVSFEGMLGRMVGMFGGKAAKEGIESTTAVKGDRKATMTDTTGQIVDLSEEKVYEMDLKKKTYAVITFDEIRRRMREAQERAAKDAEKTRGRDEKAEPSQPEREYEVDFDVKQTGEKKQIAGYDAHEVVMTIAIREKGRTLEESGGFVMTADSWMGPVIPAMKEVAAFDIRYWKQLQPDAPGMSAEQMAAVMAMYPQMKTAMERLQKESGKLTGTPLETTTTFDAVKSAEQMAASQSQNTSGGGLGGMLARKMMKKNDASLARQS